MRHILHASMLTALVIMQSCRTMPNTSDPKAVAESFLKALLDGDQDKALSHVWEKDQQEFQQWFTYGLPPDFPKTVHVEIFHKKKSNGQKAGANFLGGKEESYGVDMEFQDGRWWVTKQ